MAAAIGIDLGVTNSEVAYMPPGGVPKVLANRERGTVTPSVVARHKDGSLLVGTNAVRTGRPLVGGVGGELAKPIAIRGEGDRFEIVIPRGTRFPTAAPISVEFKTDSDNQRRVRFPIHQGSDYQASKNGLQGEIVVEIPPGSLVPKGTPFDVGFELNENGTLQIEVAEKGDRSEEHTS